MQSKSEVQGAAGVGDQFSTCDRNGAIDLLRFFGAAGIVWFHLGAPGGAFTLAALPMFVALTVYYGLREAVSVPLPDLARRRARRLLMPWALWSVVYAAAKVIQAIVTGEPISNEFRSYMVFTGPQIHLWFLPFAFIAVLTGHAFMLATRRFRIPATWLLISFVVLSASALLVFESMRPGPPVAQWLTTFPAVILGLLLIRADKDQRLLWLVLLGGAGVVILLLMFGAQWLAVPTFMAAILLCFSFVFFVPSTWWTVSLSELALGIYLAHPLVSAVLERLPGVPNEASVKAIVVIGVSAVATSALRQIPVLRRAV